jgi:hypothetical protein
VNDTIAGASGLGAFVILLCSLLLRTSELRVKERVRRSPRLPLTHPSHVRCLFTSLRSDHSRHRAATGGRGRVPRAFKVLFRYCFLWRLTRAGRRLYRQLTRYDNAVLELVMLPPCERCCSDALSISTFVRHAMAGHAAAKLQRVEVLQQKAFVPARLARRAALLRAPCGQRGYTSTQRLGWRRRCGWHWTRAMS